MAGQAYEAQALLRVCREQSAYVSTVLIDCYFLFRACEGSALACTDIPHGVLQLIDV